MLQTRFLRDRLQRCRGELSQIIGMTHQLEQAEEQWSGAGAARPLWQQAGRYGGRADSSAAASTFGRHESQAVTMLGRIRQAADRCARTLSEVEREVDVLTGSQSPSGFQSSDPWQPGASEGTYRDRSTWSTGQWSAQSTSVPGESPARSPSWGASTYASGIRSTGQPGTFQYGRDADPDRVQGSFSQPAGRFSSRGAVPASQQGGYDYGYGSARGGWNGRQSWSTERPLTYAGAASARY